MIASEDAVNAAILGGRTLSQALLQRPMIILIAAVHGVIFLAGAVKPDLLYVYHACLPKNTIHHMYRPDPLPKELSSYRFQAG
jgi:hypothetical protein